VGEQGILTTSQYGGHVAAVAGEKRVAYRIDTPVDPVQAPGVAARLHGAGTEAQGTQISERHDAVLARGHLSDLSLQNPAPDE
jgi:hypothetical protein